MDEQQGYAVSPALHALRVDYLDAAIAELNCVANVVENPDPAKSTMLKRLAQMAGDHAQQKYEAFVAAAIDEHPGVLTSDDEP